MIIGGALLALGLIAPAPALADVPSKQDRRDAKRFARCIGRIAATPPTPVGCYRVRMRVGEGDGNIFGAGTRHDRCSIYLNATPDGMATAIAPTGGMSAPP